MQLEKREYMEEARASVRKNYLDGVLQQLIVMATGTGKTVLFSLLIHDLKELLPGKVLVFAHREELVDQAIETIKALNPTLKVGKEMANDQANTDSDVVVSCVASIGRSGNTRLTRFGLFSLVICDEAHHSIAQTYLNVFETTGVLKPESKTLLLGFTATPKRRNLKRKEKQEAALLDDEELVSLRSVYQKIVFTYPIKQAIKDGWLVPLRGYRVSSGISLDHVKTTAGDFQQDELQRTVNTDERNKLAVDSYIEHGEGRQAVAFTSGIQHAKDMAESFRKEGINAEAIWGQDPERAQKIEKHKKKEITVLTNVDVLTEGYDDWRVSCIIDAAPTQSPSKYTQRVGRGTRLQSGSGNLLKALQEGYALEKKDCIVVDVVDNFKKNKLITLPTLVGLSPMFNLHGGSVTKAADELEVLQSKFPGVNFTHLTDLDKVKTYVESIDLFADSSKEEIGDLSNLMWMPKQDGSYIISMPETKYIQSIGYKAYQHEKWVIKPNELGEFEVWVNDRNKQRQVGEYTTIEKAFSEADDAIRRFRHDRIKPLLRKAEWHEYPATEPAKRYLAKLSRNKPMPYCLCSTPVPEYGLEGNCLSCHKKTGITAGQVSIALNKLKAS